MNPDATILVVEDQVGEREALVRLLRMERFHVLAAASAEQANGYLDRDIDIVVSDLRMPRTDGIELLRFWKRRQPHVPFIMITAHGDVHSAVAAMKQGAEDFLTKPVNPEELLLVVRTCLDSSRGATRMGSSGRQFEHAAGFERIIGQSKAMMTVFDKARRASVADSTVLITGESGTGKELFAEAIHRNSPRKDSPFVTVNMAAVPEHLVESELFGHTKGAFTGATESRTGRFEQASNGTIFIDEIGDFAHDSQAKLLRVLEDHTVTPVGSNLERQVNVRVVAATSRNLEQLVRTQRFREDLYYRLNVIAIHLPPLRDRRDDIPRLIDHFLDQLTGRSENNPLRLAPELNEFLLTYDWPGNVRQLHHCLESMVVLAHSDQLTLDDVPVAMRPALNGAASVDHQEYSLARLQRDAVERALEQAGGNRTHAARALGISVRTLQRRLKSWFSDEPDPSP